MIRPGQLIAAVALSGFGLCAAAALFLRFWRPELGRVTTN